MKELICLMVITIVVMMSVGVFLSNAKPGSESPKPRIKVHLNEEIPNKSVTQYLTVFTADGRTFATVVSSSGSLSLIELQNYKPVVEDQNTAK